MLFAHHFLAEAKIFHSPRLIDKPEVSIILPTYRRAADGLLARSIESVLSQSFTSFELLVMDDGSSDGTEDVLTEFIKADDRVLHVRHDHNSGLPALRVNEGLLLARGTFCAYQFDDDRWTNSAMELLTNALKSHDNYDVAYGRCRYAENGIEYHIGEAFDYGKLINGNYIANNSVVHRRSVFERFGGYDMHLVMRRLCDWDLWLRWGRQVRFLFVDEIVSLVEAAMEGSLGKTIHYDALAARTFMARERNHLLTPGALKDYELDSLDGLKHLGADKTAEIWRQQIALFQSRHREIWPKVTPIPESPMHVIVTKAHFDTTIDITINNFQKMLAADFAFTFIPQAQVDEVAIRSADILLLHRTIDFHAQELVKIARKHGKSVVFLMDDDLLTFHELSDEFSYLAPGAPCRGALESLISDADLVVTYSHLMQESVAALNPRNVRLETNIQGHWLKAAKARLAVPQDKTSTSNLPVKIGFAGGGARKEEFAVLWPAIVEVSRQLKDHAEFHFWGFTPNNIDQLKSPSYCEGFTYSYDEYLSRLTIAGFDVMIVPLFAELKAKRAKCPIKFLESTAAGAIGVFSDTEPYEVVRDGVTGFKCANTLEAWTNAILKASRLTVSQRHAISLAALEQVERVYTSERQASRVSATLEAALLHGRLNRWAGSGKPRIAYFSHSPYLGGAENHLLRHALIAQSFQFEPILVIPASAMHINEEMQRRSSAAGIKVEYLPLLIETEVNNERILEETIIGQISAWLLSNQISLVHSVTLMRELGVAARRIGLPHISSLYQTNSLESSEIDHCTVIHSDSLLYANQWAHVLGVPSRRILSFVPEDYYQIGVMAKRSGLSSWRDRKLRVGLFGTLQARKGQKQAIEALGMLFQKHGIEMSLDIYGYDQFFPDYLEECKTTATQYGIDKLIKFHGFIQNTAPVLSEIDIVLCASDWESLPQVILEGMAARRLVVSPAVGGVAEVLTDKNGIVIRNNSAAEICEGLLKAVRLDTNDLESRLNLAQDVVEAECTKHSVATSLFQLYRFAQSRVNRKQDFPKNPVSALDGTVLPQREAFLANTLERVHRQLHECNMVLPNTMETL